MINKEITMVDAHGITRHNTLLLCEINAVLELAAQTAAEIDFAYNPKRAEAKQEQLGCLLSVMAHTVKQVQYELDDVDGFLEEKVEEEKHHEG